MKYLITTILLICLPLGLPAATDTIALRSGDVTPNRTTTSSPDPDLRLVKFPAPVTRAQLDALDATTLQVYTYLPHHAFLVRVDGDPSRLSDIGASWSVPLLTDDKISPEIAATRDDQHQSWPVMLHVLPDADLSATVTAVEELAGKRVEGSAALARFSRIRVVLDGAQIATLREPFATLPSIVWIERESRKVFLNDSTTWVGQTGTAGGSATTVFNHGIFGQGQVVGVLDTGIDIDSCYFADPLQTPALNMCDGGITVNNDHRKVIAVDFLWDAECSSGISDFEWDTHDHGTHVAGTVAGDKTTFGSHDGRDGMAPQAKLVIQDCGLEFNLCADCPGLDCPVIDLVPVFEQPYQQGARIHTNSWGDEEEDSLNYGEYTSGSEDADQTMWNHKDYLLLFAAGNNGGTSNTVDSPSTAKSVLSIGATNHGSSADSIASFSSRGPTDDGRIKPSVTIVGSSVMSANNDLDIGTDNCTDRSMSGTSMAAPGAAGLVALVRQYLVDGFHPSGAADPISSMMPSAALLRAAIVNSGEQMSNAGTIPNNDQGWGRILLDNVLYFPGDSRRLWIEDDQAGFANGAAGQTRIFQIDVNSSAEPLEVTLAWTDFPSTPIAATNIVNDLDLTISGPGGTFLGNVFSGGVSITGGSSDRVNTLENVLITSPDPGQWTVTVTANNVPEGPQPFALVATGNLDISVPHIFSDGFESGTTNEWSGP